VPCRVYVLGALSYSRLLRVHVLGAPSCSRISACPSVGQITCIHTTRLLFFEYSSCALCCRSLLSSRDVLELYHMYPRVHVHLCTLLLTFTSCPSLRTVSSHVYARPVSCLLEPSYCRILAHHMYLFYSRHICLDGFLWRDNDTFSVDTESAILRFGNGIE